MGTDMLGPEDTKMDLLDPSALEEISQLQESILHTLRNELKKLKEPEVIGASNVSSPRFAIGQDMTPLPSLHGSAISMLQPVRRYSPIRMYSKQKYKLLNHQRSKGIMRKKSVSSTVSSSRKYDYRSRNYPRPWAETPRRRRTLSNESLEVHVTSSHFSDLSTLSLLAQEEEEEESKTKMEHEMFLPAAASILMEGPAPLLAAVGPTQSCEKWHNTVKWVNSKKNNNSLRTTSKPRTAVRRSTSRHFRYSSRPKTQVVEQENKDQPVPTNGAVIFPAPVEKKKPKGPSSKKKLLDKVPNASKKNRDNQNHTEASNATNSSPVLANSNINNSNQWNLPQVMICRKLHQHTKATQVSLDQDQEVQTEHVLSTISSEFELGLMIATLLDKLVDETLDRLNANSCQPADETALKENSTDLNTDLSLGKKLAPQRAQSDMCEATDTNNNEFVFNQSITACCLLTQGTSPSKNPSSHCKTDADTSPHSSSTAEQNQFPPEDPTPASELAQSDIHLSTTPSRPNRIPHSETSSPPHSSPERLKNSGTNPMKRRYARVSKSRRHYHDWHIAPTPEDLSKTGNQGINQSPNHHHYHRKPSTNSVPTPRVFSLHPNPFSHRNSNKSIASTRPKSRRRLPLTPAWRKKLYHRLAETSSEDTDTLPADDSSIDSNHFNSNSYYHQTTTTDEDDDLDSYQKPQKNIPAAIYPTNALNKSSFVPSSTILPRRRTPRKRNISMSYQTPDFADLFPHADYILNEAHHILNKHNYYYASNNQNSSNSPHRMRSNTNVKAIIPSPLYF